VSKWAAISLFSRPSAAYKMTLALITSIYDDVYLRAIAWRIAFSSAVNKIVTGLILGITCSLC
jgi:hypothetical protein